MSSRHSFAAPCSPVRGPFQIVFGKWADCSSSASFAGWRERAGKPFAPRLPDGYRTLITWFPKTWLLSTGWRRHGPTIRSTSTS